MFSKGIFVVFLVQASIGYNLDRLKELNEDFYGTISTPVNRLQNLFRANVAPTFWCGIRNSAPFPEALSAIYPHLDSCCRAHDLCPFQIERGECFEGICNPSFLTPILSCECEYEFRDCLKSLPLATSTPQFPVKLTERLLTDATGIGYFGILPRIVEHNCLMKKNPEITTDNSSWTLVSLNRNFNHRDWFRPESYANVDFSQLADLFPNFSTEDSHQISDE